MSSIVSNVYKTRPFSEVFERYAAKVISPFGIPYVLTPNYFYTVQPENPKHWRELGGIHVEIAIPDSPRLPSAEAAEIVRKELRREFALYRVPTLSTGYIPADVHVTPGGASAGFRSLAAALDYLEAHPQKSVWVMNWDSPGYPDDESLAENGTLLILAGPQLDTRREPLAWIARSAVRSVADAEPADGRSRAAQAWHDALRVAAEQANVPPERIGRVIHDQQISEAVGSTSWSGDDRPHLDIHTAAADDIVRAWIHDLHLGTSDSGLAGIDDTVVIVVLPNKIPHGEAFDRDGDASCALTAVDVLGTHCNGSAADGSWRAGDQPR